MSLGETFYKFRGALDEFTPAIKNLEDQVQVLEGRVDNLNIRKQALDGEIKDKIVKSDQVLAMDKFQAKSNLENAERLLKEANEIYLQLYKAKATQNIPSKEEGAKILEKLQSKHAEVAKEKARI